MTWILSRETSLVGPGSIGEVVRAMQALNSTANVFNSRGCKLEAIRPHVCDEPFSCTARTQMMMSSALSGSELVKTYVVTLALSNTRIKYYQLLCIHSSLYT